jgi:hypothetical protein
MQNNVWDRSETLALALSGCTRCHGLGLVQGKRGRSSPCNCVLRAVFRACYARFRHCVMKEKYVSRASMQFVAGPQRRLTWGRKDEEYLADFYLVSKRYLTEAEFRLFKYHFLYGADWKLCCRKLKMDRGNFFHAVYRIQQNLGRVFRELEPYGLYPLDEYFHSTYRRTGGAVVAPRVVPIRPVNGAPALRPPIRLSA